MHSPQEERVWPDVLVNNVGTLYTFCPLTLRAKEWLDEHVQDDAQWFGHALIVEHRYAWGLAQGRTGWTRWSLLLGTSDRAGNRLFCLLGIPAIESFPVFVGPQRFQSGRCARFAV